MKRNKALFQLVCVCLVMFFAVFSLLQKGEKLTFENLLKELDQPTLTPAPQSTGHVSGVASPSASFLVKKVIDGDTIELENGVKLRYIGVDTPETKHPQREVECFGQEAYLQNKLLVEGKQVTLEKDVSESDRYGRLLRYVYLDGVLINEFLVLQGYAHAVSYPPDIKYQERLNNAEKTAREQVVGLWKECQ